MKREHAAAIFWSGFEAGLSALLSVASAFLVARIIGPAEVGIGAAAVAVHVLLWVPVNALFADALVQAAAISRRAFAAALAVSGLVGGGAATLMALAGAPLSWALDDARLPAMACVLALPLLPVGLAGPVQGLLTREKRYKDLALRTVVGQGLGTSVGIGAALAGGGAWALVLQQGVVSLAGALALLARSPWAPCLGWCWSDAASLLRLGLPLTASTLVQHGRYRLFAVLVGGTAGPAVLGEVHMAFRLVDTVRELAFTALWRLLLPVLSRRQDDMPGLLAAMDRCLAWMGLVAFPLCAAMALSVGPVVGWVLGPAWAQASQAALPLILLTAWLFLCFPAGVAVVSRGEPRYALIANVAGAAATLLFVLLVRPATPLAAVGAWLAGQLFVSPYIFRTNAKVLGVRLLRPVRAGLLPLLLALAAGLVGFAGPWLVGEPASAAGLLAARLAWAAAAFVAGGALLRLDRRVPGMADLATHLTSRLRARDANLRL